MGSLESSIRCFEMNLAMFDLKNTNSRMFLSQYVFSSPCCPPAFSGRRRTPAAKGLVEQGHSSGTHALQPGDHSFEEVPYTSEPAP